MRFEFPEILILIDNASGGGVSVCEYCGRYPYNKYRYTADNTQLFKELFVRGVPFKLLFVREILIAAVKVNQISGKKPQTY